MAEQFVGQHLLCLSNEGLKPEIFYWLREGKKNNAETDYLLQCNTQIVPIEVKSGKAGTLKSLHQFVFEMNSPLEIRFDMQQPSFHPIDICIATQDNTHNVKFNLLSLPVYMVEECRRLVEELQ